MPTDTVNAFVQARMSSSRFPGKVLAPYKGMPIIWHVVQAVRSVPRIDRVVVATSTDAADEPLVSYLRQIGVDVFRGPLSDVFERFRRCLAAFPCDWFIRVCADSPRLQPSTLVDLIDLAMQHRPDMATTRAVPARFPKGQNAEMVWAESFRAIDPDDLTPSDREHVTPYYYRNRDRFRVIELAPRTEWSTTASFAVDTPDDLRALEARG
jgi:spore coat polysaccharide biosynthesis protein SpsF